MSPTFKGAVAKLWRSLKARHCGKSKYGPCPITREQFTQWLWEQSEGGMTWRCEYTGNVLQLMAKTQAGRLTLDHKVPLSRGGTSTLDNLAVCSEEANKVKGDMTDDRFNSLIYFLGGWPPEARESVWKRLKGWEPVYRRKRA